MKLEPATEPESERQFARLRTGNPLESGFATDGLTIYRVHEDDLRGLERAAAAERARAEKAEFADAALVAEAQRAEDIATAPRAKPT